MWLTKTATVQTHVHILCDITYLNNKKGVASLWTAPVCADSTKKATMVAIIKI